MTKASTSVVTGSNIGGVPSPLRNGAIVQDMCVRSEGPVRTWARAQIAVIACHAQDFEGKVES